MRFLPRFVIARLACKSWQSRFCEFRGEILRLVRKFYKTQNLANLWHFFCLKIQYEII
ncbi:hypothetical protein [Helicobacter sp. 23-1045]